METCLICRRSTTRPGLLIVLGQSVSEGPLEREDGTTRCDSCYQSLARCRRLNETALSVKSAEQKVSREMEH
jgi:hypothetical protein